MKQRFFWAKDTKRDTELTILKEKKRKMIAEYH